MIDIVHDWEGVAAHISPYLSHQDLGNLALAHAAGSVPVAVGDQMEAAAPPSFASGPLEAARIHHDLPGARDRFNRAFMPIKKVKAVAFVTAFITSNAGAGMRSCKSRHKSRIVYGGRPARKYVR